MKKLMSVLLALALVLAMVPVAASAADGDVELPDGYTQQVPADRMTTELVSGVTATVEKVPLPTRWIPREILLTGIRNPV